MITNLNNSNSSGRNEMLDANIKKVEKELERYEAETDVKLETLDDSIQGVDSDLQALKTNLELQDSLQVDYISSKNNSDIHVNDKIITPEVESTKLSTSCILVDGVDIVQDYNTKISGAITNADNAVCKADEAVCSVTDLDSKIECLCSSISDSITTKDITSECERTQAIETKAITITECGEALDFTAHSFRNGITYLDAFIEPTVKDSDAWYLFRLPAHFNGKIHFLGVDQNKTLFTADWNIGNATDGTYKKGTGLVVHNGNSIYDFFQILYNPFVDQYSFVTQSNISRLYYRVEDTLLDYTPIYETYSNLTDQSPDYDRDQIKYEAKHSEQVVVIGDENTLNGGMSVMGTFYATGFEVPETILTNVHVKCQIYGGYNCSVGEFNTCGTTGGLITYSCENNADPLSPFPTEVVTWVNGCPRTVVRKGVCVGEDVDHNECSQLTYEAVKTCNPTGTFIPEMTDRLFDERGLATYNGTACDGSPTPLYPIVNLGGCSCVHGDLEVECKAIVGEKAVLHCVENTQSCNFNFTNTEQATFTNAKNITVNGCCDVNVNVCGNLITNAESVCSVIECETKQVNNTAAIRYNCGLSFIAQGGDIDFCNSSNSINIGACCDINLTTPTTSIHSNITDISNLTQIDCLKVNKVIGLLENTGDIRTHGQVIADGDITTHGDLIVGGSVVATTETQIATTGDYLVTRENSQAAMASTEHSGIVVNNYDGNGSISTLTSDYNGEWRVSDTSSATTTVYTNISNYNNVWYNGLTQTAAVSHPVGVLTETNMIELSFVAYYNSNYYHRNGENWFGPITVVSGQFDLGDMITDATTITALEALPTYSLIYYNSAKDTVISIAQNQPLLTRDEKTNLTAGSPLVWDSTNERAINTPAPGGEQVWKSSIDNLGNITYG